MDGRERRQLEGMLNQADAFEARRIDLDGLISSLEALFNALEEAPPEWRNEFRRHWGVLEEVYAVAADQGRMPSSPAEEALVFQAVRSLRGLVQGHLDAREWPIQG
jgi:hypothetical protein